MALIAFFIDPHPSQLGVRGGSGAGSSGPFARAERRSVARERDARPAGRSLKLARRSCAVATRAPLVASLAGKEAEPMLLVARRNAGLEISGIA